MSHYSAEHLAWCCFVEETLRRDTEPNRELGVTKQQNVYKPNNRSSRYIGPAVTTKHSDSYSTGHVDTMLSSLRFNFMNIEHTAKRRRRQTERHLTQPRPAGPSRVTEQVYHLSRPATQTKEVEKPAVLTLCYLLLIVKTFPNITFPNK